MSLQEQTTVAPSRPVDFDRLATMAKRASAVSFKLGRGWIQVSLTTAQRAELAQRLLGNESTVTER